jgi:hypothetical protein
MARLAAGVDVIVLTYHRPIFAQLHALFIWYTRNLPVSPCGSRLVYCLSQGLPVVRGTNGYFPFIWGQHVCRALQPMRWDEGILVC